MEHSESFGFVHSLESFGAADGPGMRFVVFLQGCDMRCKFCHNPETWSQGCDKWKAQRLSAKELFDKAYKYKNYWGKNMEKGGVTVSGGEPLLQLDFVTEFFALAKQKGVHTTLDTAGHPFSRNPEFLDKFDTLMQYCDLVMLDIKAFGSKLHKELTGCDNESILAMAKYLSDIKKPVWIRRVLVPGITDGEKELCDTREFINSLSNVEKVEILPYHTLGLFKWQKLGLEYPLEGISSPTDQQIARAKDILGIK